MHEPWCKENTLLELIEKPFYKKNIYNILDNIKCSFDQRETFRFAT